MRARASLLLAFAALAGCTAPAAEKETAEGERVGQTRTYAPTTRLSTPSWVLDQAEPGKRALAQVDEVVNGPGGVTGCEAPIPEAMRGFPLMAPPSSEPSAAFVGEHFAQLKSAAPPPRAAPDPTLELRITGPATRKAGEYLDLELEMINGTQDDLVVLRSLDGSIDHWRNPYYDLYLEEVSTGRQFRWERRGDRCGNVNAIDADDYVELPPGGANKKVTDVWGGYLRGATIGKAGTYRVWVVYQFCGFQKGGLPLGKDLERADTHVGIHVSNAITLDVR